MYQNKDAMRKYCAVVGVLVEGEDLKGVLGQVAVVFYW